jgi:predicted methyltransferase MtxX (methanogen marker protein 4)
MSDLQKKPASSVVASGRKEVIGKGKTCRRWLASDDVVTSDEDVA